MLLYTHSSGLTESTAEPVILIHGLFGSYENLGVIARSLSEQYHIINVDVRNHGRSGHSDQMNYQLMADDLAQTLDALNISKAALLGHSMGGQLAMTLALLYPHRVTKLIAADVAPVAYPARHNNIFSGLFGGIPATGAIARTATNIKNSGENNFKTSGTYFVFLYSYRQSIHCSSRSL